MAMTPELGWRSTQSGSDAIVPPWLLSCQAPLQYAISPRLFPVVRKKQLSSPGPLLMQSGAPADVIVEIWVYALQVPPSRVRAKRTFPAPRTTHVRLPLSAKHDGRDVRVPPSPVGLAAPAGATVPIVRVTTAVNATAAATPTRVAIERDPRRRAGRVRTALEPFRRPSIVISPPRGRTICPDGCARYGFLRIISKSLGSS